MHSLFDFVKILIILCIYYVLYIGVPVHIKLKYMKLIYIRSTMEPKNYSTLRSLLKQGQGVKIAP